MGNGREKTTFPIVAAAIAGEPIEAPQRWLLPGRGTANHRLLDIAIGAVLAMRGDLRGKGKSDAIPRALAVARDQVYHRGLGVVEGSTEGWTPDPHAELHLAPTVLIALEAHRHRYEVIRDHWLMVLGMYRGLWRMGASPDGQVVLPGTRFWAVKQPIPDVDADGWHWMHPGQTLSQTTDALYRELEGLPHRDNRGRERPDPPVVKPSLAGLRELLAAGLEIPVLQPRLPVEIECLHSSPGVLHLRLADWSAGGGSTHSVAVEVRAVWRSPGKHLVAYKPRPKNWRRRAA